MLILRRVRHKPRSAHHIHHASVRERALQHVRRPPGPVPVGVVVVPIDGTVRYDERVLHIPKGMCELRCKTSILFACVMVAIPLEGECTHVKVWKGSGPALEQHGVDSR